MFRDHRTFDLQQKPDGTIQFTQSLVISLSLGDDHVRTGEDFFEGFAALFQYRSRRVVAVVDHPNEFRQARRFGIDEGGIIDNGASLDRDRHPLFRQEIQQQLIEDDLAGVVREIQNLFGRF